MNLHLFTFLSVPVHVSLWFFVIVGWMSFSGGDLRGGAVWAGTIAFSILVHEYGHALVARHYRLSPQILLHGWGGLCAHDRAERDRHDALIVAAGPGAGLLLGGLTIAVGAFVLPHIPHEGTSLALAIEIVSAMTFVNIFWSLVNLLPVWPLDGGQLFRLAMVQLFGGARGERYAHLVGTVTGVAGAVVGYQFLGSLFIGLGGLYLAWVNFEKLRGGGVSGPIRPRYKFAKGLLAEAEAALTEGRWAEAARLCHQIRWLDTVSDEIMLKVWQFLAFSTAMDGDPEEACRYVRRAPSDGPTRLAEAHALERLGRITDAREALAGVGRLPPWARAHAVAIRERFG